MSDRGRPWWAYGCSQELTPRDLANLRRANGYFALYLGAFLVALMTAAWRLLEGPLVLLVVPLLVMASVPFYRAVVTFLEQADELTRRIHLQAMATGFGAALLLVLLERVAAELVEIFGQDSWVEFVADVLNPMSWMIFAYFLALARLQRRYGG